MLRGECFGELALEREEVRSANVIASGRDGVKCLCLDRDAYNKLIGTKITPMAKLKKFSPNLPSEFHNIKLKDLNIIRALGEGGFGRVELCYVSEIVAKYQLPK